MLYSKIKELNVQKNSFPEPFFMVFINDFRYSYWEIKQYFQRFDAIIIGAGIVGLSTAVSFKSNHPKAKVLVLERGVLPNGASTKNAGFACFGSAGELLDDLKKMAPETVWETVEMRWNGLQFLRERLKDRNIGYQPYGGFELFTQEEEFEKCREQIGFLNTRIKNSIGLSSCFRDISGTEHPMKKFSGVIFNAFEGQIDTALMMKNLLRLARKNDIEVLNNIHVLDLCETGSSVQLKTNHGVFEAGKVVVATNGFARTLLPVDDVKPARAQVLITKPIPGLKIKGAYHFSEGYYYFRDLDRRILLGGGRNLDFEGETTAEQGLNSKIQDELERLLKEMILPGYTPEIEHRWSGIMGVGSEKKPIIKWVGKNILVAVRMGGMGIAIGSLVGEQAAREMN